jgi:hypothetical protein
MRRCGVVLLLVAVGCGTATTFPTENGQPPQPENKPPPLDNHFDYDYGQWKLYAPKDAGFEVRFPHDPVMKSTKQGSETIMVAGIQRHAPDEFGYVCQWVIKAQPFANAAAETAYLNGQQQGAVQSSRGKLVAEKALALDGMPGREFVVELPDKEALHSRVYLAGKRAIILQVFGKDKDAVCSKDSMQFLDSLKISK